MSVIYSYKELIVWQKGIDLVTQVYAMTNGYPQSEMYGVVSQMRRAAVSIPANIAEGRRRGTRKDYCRFLLISYASGSELETYMEISKNLQFTSEHEMRNVEDLLQQVMKMLHSMLRTLRENQAS